MNNEKSNHNGALSPGQRALEWLALACLLASPLFAPVLIGGVRLWASGPLMALVFLAALLVCLRALWWREEGAALRLPPGSLAWLGFLGYGVVAIFAYGTPYEARVELLRAASLWAAYWAWANLMGRDNRWRWVLGLVLLAGTLNALYGLVNYFQGAPDRVLWFDRAAEGSGQYTQRISGTYFCPNHWASLLAMLAPVALALVFTPEAGVFLRVLAGYALLTFLPAIHVSQSRAGWIGLAAGLSVATLDLVWRRSRAWFAVLLVVLPLALAGGAVLYWKLSPEFHQRFREAAQELAEFRATGGGGFRLSQWADTWLMIKARPWFGHGPGSYCWVAEAFRRHMLDAKFQAVYAHDDYLQSLAENGVVGTLLLALPLVWLLLRLGRTLHRTKNLNNAGLLAGLLGAWTAMLTHAAFDFNLRIYANVAVLALLTGVVAGRLYVRHDWNSALTPANRRRLAGAGAVLSLLLLGVMSWMLVSYYLEVRAGALLRQVNYEQSGRLARLAWRVDPGNWYAAETLGTLLQMRARWGQDERQRKTDAAESAHWFEVAARGNADDMETRHYEGLSLIAIGQTDAGLRLLRQAADTNPINVEFRSQLGLQLRGLGCYAEALAEFRKAAAIRDDAMIEANLRWLQKKIAK